MGQTCQKYCTSCINKFYKPKTIPLVSVDDKTVEKENDVEFKKYSSTLDKFFVTIEESYMILRYFQMFDILLLFTKAKPQSSQLELSADNQVAKPYLEELEKVDFMLFLEHKVIKNYLVVSILNDNEEIATIFKEFMSELYDSLLLARIDNHKKKNPGVKVKKGSIKSIKKLYLYPIAVLFSSSTNRNKIEFLFSLLSDEKRNFPKSQDLIDFIFFLFMVGATCSFRAIRNTADKFPTKLNSISKEEYLAKSDAFEVDDIIRLRDIFITDFFKSQEYVTRDQFDHKFKNEEFGWIFSTSGIRFHLEKHNDIKIEIPEN
jgi:hypothetical protein